MDHRANTPNGLANLCTNQFHTPSGGLPWRLRLEHALKESGFCVDSPVFLRLILCGGWPRTLLMRFLRAKFSPLLLERIRRMDLPLSNRSALFTQGISLINARETYKTTGRSRTKLVDAAVLRHAEGLQPLRLLEVGVSDGVSSLDLLEALPKHAQVTLSDRHPFFTRRGIGPASIILDGCGRVLGLKVFCFYLNIPANIRLSTARGQRLDTTNPLLAEGTPPRHIHRFDVCADVAEEPFPLIKCANVFNRKYFSTQAIVSSVDNLACSLTEGGLLFISQNNARYAEGEAYFILRKQAGRMILVEERNRHEAVDLFEGESSCASS